MSYDQDWDDNLEPDQRASIMNSMAKKMGLEPRYGNFQAGAQEGKSYYHSAGMEWEGDPVPTARRGKGA